MACAGCGDPLFPKNVNWEAYGKHEADHSPEPGTRSRPRARAPNRAHGRPALTDRHAARYRDADSRSQTFPPGAAGVGSPRPMIAKRLERALFIALVAAALASLGMARSATIRDGCRPPASRSGWPEWTLTPRRVDDLEPGRIRYALRV